MLTNLLFSNGEGSGKKIGSPPEVKTVLSTGRPDHNSQVSKKLLQ